MTDAERAFNVWWKAYEFKPENIFCLDAWEAACAWQQEHDADQIKALEDKLSKATLAVWGKELDSFPKELWVSGVSFGGHNNKGLIIETHHRAYLERHPKVKTMLYVQSDDWFKLREEAKVLAEQVINLNRRNSDLVLRSQRYQKALEFYADAKHYVVIRGLPEKSEFTYYISTTQDIHDDQGKRAREALEPKDE